MRGTVGTISASEFSSASVSSFWPLTVMTAIMRRNPPRRAVMLFAAILSAQVPLGLASAAVPSGVAMGRTPGSFTVTATGAASYSIPLWTPPGIAGLTPSLALMYSSNSGDGLYGVGWGIAGFSNITRCKKTLVQDGISASVLLTTDDRACLDGNKLRTFNGTPYSMAPRTGRTARRIRPRLQTSQRSYFTMPAAPFPGGLRCTARTA
jgi:hypothetical protein